LRTRHDDALVLIDLPPDKPGSNSSLQYLREEDGHRPESDEFALGELEESPVWRTLRGEARLGLAKLRVFVHPRYFGVMSSAVSREEFEGMLNNSVKAALALK